MAVDLNYTKTNKLGGKTFNQQAKVSGKTGLVHEELQTKAFAATLTTRTDNDTGSLTIAASPVHNIATGNKVDLYWDVGGVKGTRRNVTVGTVAGNVVPIDLGVGDNLPAAASAIIVSVIKTLTIGIASANIVGYSVYCATRGNIVFADAGGAELKAYILPQSVPQTEFWTNDSGITNPLAGGDVASIRFSHADIANTKDVKASVVFNP